MKIICAGMLKTGTKSVAAALRILGYNVHDVEEHWKYHLDEYHDAVAATQIPDFTTMYANVDAVTDSPACFFWEEILATSPDAKVLLMVRDSGEVWVESFRKTSEILKSLAASFPLGVMLLLTPTGRKWVRLMEGIGRKLHVEDLKPDVYTKHNARVKSAVPQDQLLVYNVKQGWKPLCEFLGVEVPDVPFPRLNVNSELIENFVMNSSLQGRMNKELCFILGLIVLICALLAYSYLLF